MLYPLHKVNELITKENILWDIQKNIEVDVKWAQKKEELEKETRENKIKRK